VPQDINKQADSDARAEYGAVQAETTGPCAALRTCSMARACAAHRPRVPTLSRRVAAHPTHEPTLTARAGLVLGAQTNNLEIMRARRSRRRLPPASILTPASFLYNEVADTAAALAAAVSAATTPLAAESAAALAAAVSAATTPLAAESAAALAAERESGAWSLFFQGVDILPDLMGMVEDSVSPKFTERLVREALEGVEVELRAKAEVSDEQLKALVPKLEALFCREEVHWRIPLKLRAAAGLADEQEQSDLRWAGESKRAGLTMGPRPPPSETVDYTPPRVQRPPPRAHQPEQRFRKLHPRTRSPPMHKLSKEPPKAVTAYVKQCLLAVERLSNTCRLQRHRVGRSPPRHRVERSPPPVVRQAACRARTGTDVGPLPVKELDFETVRNAIAAVGCSAPPTSTVAASVPAVRTHPRPEPPRALHLPMRGHT